MACLHTSGIFPVRFAWAVHMLHRNRFLHTPPKELRHMNYNCHTEEKKRPSEVLHRPLQNYWMHDAGRFTGARGASIYHTRTEASLNGTAKERTWHTQVLLYPESEYYLTVTVRLGRTKTKQDRNEKKVSNITALIRENNIKLQLYSSDFPYYKRLKRTTSSCCWKVLDVCVLLM